MASSARFNGGVLNRNNYKIIMDLTNTLKRSQMRENVKDDYVAAGPIVMVMCADLDLRPITFVASPTHASYPLALNPCPLFYVHFLSLSSSVARSEKAETLLSTTSGN